MPLLRSRPTPRRQLDQVEREVGWICPCISSPRLTSLQSCNHLRQLVVGTAGRISNLAILVSSAIARTLPDDTDDLVTHDLLSLAEAELLLRLFFDNLNPMISLFDQALHTLNYLRSTSSALTSAILAMSAKFFRSDLHLPILRHYHTISSRALNSDQCSTALVQSLMVDVYWKDVKDVSAWRKIGAAIRMGYQMRWHEIRKSALPVSEHEARVILVSNLPEYSYFGLNHRGRRKNLAV
jgi:hypothetical protein